MLVMKVFMCKFLQFLICPLCCIISGHLNSNSRGRINFPSSFANLWYPGNLVDNHEKLDRLGCQSIFFSGFTSVRYCSCSAALGGLVTSISLSFYIFWQFWLVLFQLRWNSWRWPPSQFDQNFRVFLATCVVHQCSTQIRCGLLTCPTAPWKVAKCPWPIQPFHIILILEFFLITINEIEWFRRVALDFS